MKRALLRTLPLVLLAVCSACSTRDEATAPAWPAWTLFTEQFVEPNGRVVDVTFEHKTTSEGQSYALFFALVANDPALFERVLHWTSRSLASGRLGRELPAWHWGKRSNGTWGVKDRNSASDADLWLAYTLLEAGRLWQQPRYTRVGYELLDQISHREVVEVGSRQYLLPGPSGFQLDEGRYRVNPSYYPGFLFTYLKNAQPTGPWKALWATYSAMTSRIFKAGVAPDLVVVDSLGEVWDDTERPPRGSYDAIRVYLWAGMSGATGDDALRLLQPYARMLRSLGVPPEQVDPVSGAALRVDYSPSGFSAAVLPFLHSLGDQAELQQQQRRVDDALAKALSTGRSNYYDQALILFGEGWVTHRFHFDAAGRLHPAWAP